MPMQSAKQLTGNMETGTMGHGLFGTIGIAKELVKSASSIIIAITKSDVEQLRLLFCYLQVRGICSHIYSDVFMK